MSIKSLHIKVEQELQRYDSQREFDYQPEQIDLAINKEIVRYVKEKYGGANKYGKGFEDSRKRLDDLSPLVKYMIPLPLFKDISVPFSAVSFTLPEDCMIFENAAVKVAHHQNKFNMVFEDTEVTDYVAHFKYPSLFDNFSFSASGDIFTAFPVSSELLAEISTYNSPEDLEVFKINIINFYKEVDGLSIYWESYKDLYKPNSFIFVTEDENYLNTTASFMFGETAYSGIFKEHKYFNISYDDGIPEQENKIKHKLSPLKYVEADRDVSKLSDSFFKTIFEEPLFNYNRNKGVIMHDNSFLPEEVYVTYIKYPTMVSYNRDVSSEFDFTRDDEIISNVVVSLLENSRAERLETKLLMNQRKE